MAKNVPCTVLIMTALSACGGGTGPGVDAEMIETLASRAEANPPPADPLELPAQATLSGFIAIEVDSEIIPGPIIGDMEMTADFGADAEITGVATNLGEYEETGDCDLTSNCVYNLVQSLDGELVLAEGIVVNDTSFEAVLDGELVRNDATDPENAVYTANITMGMNGDFFMDSDGLLAIASDDEGGFAIIDPQVGDTQEVATDGAFIVAE